MKKIKIRRVKRVYLKKWAEDLLVLIASFCFIMLFCLDDFTSILAFLIYVVTLGGILFLCVLILSLYSRP